MSGALITLTVKGLTYSERPTGAYALLLESEVDKRRLPIVIGAFEAQAIAIALDKMSTPPRPMTHDLFAQALNAHGAQLERVVVHALVDGVFYAQLHFSEGIVLDARPSDAVALAVRLDCPIYATDEVMVQAGLEAEQGPAPKRTKAPRQQSSAAGSPANPPKEDPALARASRDELEAMLDHALLQEDYELAARIRDELSQRG
ncbi:MAG: bifunctional nuclease domain-containing protein [Bacteroidota bacterium]